jgi:UDP-N-acetylglucosamine--N-acetylmuramyl-(pentapeptide) pyrophosphoryl-undecaprenol N-acetylglucosamine transferase
MIEHHDIAPFDIIEPVDQAIDKNAFTVLQKRLHGSAFNLIGLENITRKKINEYRAPKQAARPFFYFTKHLFFCILFHDASILTVDSIQRVLKFAIGVNHFIIRSGRLNVSKTFRLLVTGGGTGGHITPGLAVVEAVRKRIRHPKVLWVGVRGRREEDMVPRFDIPLTTLQLRGFERSIGLKAGWRNVATILSWMSLRPVWQARSIIHSFAPDFVLGTGGYVCAPVMIAAKLAGIPAWLLEQNSMPGLTVRLLARWVDGVATAYDMTRSRLSSRACVELIGNPVLNKIITADKKTGIEEFELDPAKKTLLVIGGSLGSEVLNRTIRDLMLLDRNGVILKNWQILHAVGPGKYETFIKTVTVRPGYHPHPFIYKTHLALAAADLVICRAGAMTLAEITARGVPSIIIPWPGAVRDHQTTNARVLDRAGAAYVLPETDVSGIRIADIIQSFNAHPSRLGIMAQKARELGKPDAAERMVDLMLSGDSY